MLTLDDYRRLIDPEGYRQAMVEHRRGLKARLAQLLVQYDLVDRSTVENKAEVLLNMQNTMSELAWAMGDIDTRLNGAQDALMGKN